MWVVLAGRRRDGVFESVTSTLVDYGLLFVREEGGRGQGGAGGGYKGHQGNVKEQRDRHRD